MPGPDETPATPELSAGAGEPDVDLVRDRLDWLENQARCPREVARTDVLLIAGSILATVALVALALMWLG